MLSYQRPRHLLSGNWVSDPVLPQRGIGPGSPFAIFELVGYLYSKIVTASALISRPGITLNLSTHVENFLMFVETRNDNDLVTTLTGIKNEVVTKIEGASGLSFDSSKAGFVLVSGSTAPYIKQVLGVWAGGTSEINALGIGFSFVKTKSKAARCGTVC